MPQRDNPLSLTVLKELDPSTFKNTFRRLVRRIERDDHARSEWLEIISDVEEQLRGKETRKSKPWKGASELSVPLTKKLLRRWLPVLYNLIAFADPVSHFKASEPNAAAKSPEVEEFFTWLLRDYMDNTLDEIQYLVYDIGAKGCGYLGVSWDYRTELESRVALVENIFPNGAPPDVRVIAQTLQQQYDLPQVTPDIQRAAQEIADGAKYVRLSFQHVVADKPRIVRHDPAFVVVPPDSGASHEAEYVALIHDYTASQLRQMARDGVLDPKRVEGLIKQAGDDEVDDKEDRTRKSRRHDNLRADYLNRKTQHDVGVENSIEDKPIRVYQVYCHLDYNRDGIGERCVLWYSPIGDNTILAVHPFVFSFRYWPVFRFDYEKVDRRPYIAQGMGQQLKDIQSQYTKQYRATSDAIDIQLAPVFQMRFTSKLQPRTVKWGPGRIMPVTQVGDIAPVEKSPLNLHEYLRERGELKAFAEEMVGSIDAALAATGSKLERRTAFEVQQVSGQIEAVQGMDSAIFQLVMGRVFQCVWELWLDFGPDVIYFNVTGKRVPKPFRKSENNHKYQLTPAGTPGNTNRSSELQRALQVTQILMQIAPDMVNRGYAVEWIARLIDPRMVERIILPQAMQQTQQIIQQAAAAVAQGDVPASMQALMATGAGGGA